MKISKILSSLLTVIVVGSALAGATYALFTSQASSQDNTFSTGNASLLIANDILPPGDPGTYSPTIPGITFSNIAPGFTFDKLFWLKNASTATIGMTVTADLADLQHAPDAAVLRDNLMISFTCDTTGQNGIDAGDPVVGPKTVQQWVDQGPELLATLGQEDGVPATTISDQNELLCKMTAVLGIDVGDAAANKGLRFDGVFDGLQASPFPSASI